MNSNWRYYYAVNYNLIMRGEEVMPFTLAHPSIVLPLRSKYFNLSGLILGAMAPDLIYFVLFSPSSNLGHTLWGSVLFNLPMCFLLNYLFYKYMQELFIFTLPKFISERYVYMTKNKNLLYGKNDILKFTYSCLVGMATHVFWDAFTHSSGFFVVNIDFLRSSIGLFGMSIPVYKILQHGSTMVGFFVIFIYVYMNRDIGKKSYNLRVNKKKICFIIVAVTVMIMMIAMGIFLKVNGHVGIGRMVVTFINSVFLSYLIVGIAYYYKRKDIFKRI